MSDYKKYYGGKNLWWSLIKTVPKFCFGAVVFYSLMRKKNDTHYLFCPPTLGDTILALSYLSEFKKQRGIQHVTVVCIESYVQRLCAYYPDTIDDVLCMKKQKLASVREFVSSKIGQYYSGVLIDRVTFVFLTCNAHLRTLWDNSIIDYPMFAKAMLYKIDLSSQPERPCIPVTDVSEIVSKYSLRRGKTVFLNAVARTVHCDITALLAAAAEKLGQAGYTVATLTANDAEEPIRGTQGIVCGLEEAFSLIEFGGALIGLRSGFMDVMVYAGCKLISIDDEGYGFKSFFCVERLGVNPDCHTVVYDGDDEKAICQIMDVFNNN